MSENWDEDSDFELPSTLSVIHSGETSERECGASGNEVECRAHNEEGEEDWDEHHDDGSSHDYGQVLQPYQRTIELITSHDPFERTESSDSALPPRTKEEEDQSTGSSRNSTIKGLMTSFSTLSLDSPNFLRGSPTESELVREDEAAPSRRNPTKMTTIRPGSDLSSLLSSALSGPGRVRHLGQTSRGLSQSVLGDWDEDLQGLDDLPTNLGNRSLRVQPSFASHISDDPEDERLKTGLPTPHTDRKIAKGSVQSLRSAFTEDDDDSKDVESDFELPKDLDHFSLSTSQRHSRGNSAHSQGAFSSNLPSTTPSPNSMSVPGLSRSDETTSEDEASDDESFFEDLVIPSYFIAGPGQLTPPSDGERGRKIDLQAVLRRKLEERGGRGLEDTRSLSTITARDRTGASRLDSYRENEVEANEAVDSQLVISDDVKLGVERMRTRSAPRPPALLKSRRANSDGTIGRTSHPGRSITPSTSARPSAAQTRLTRTGSSGTDIEASSSRTTKTAVPSYMTPGRPASAAGTIERSYRERRSGPPPALSTALRDRVRSRTLSSRSWTEAESSAKRSVLRIDTTQSSSVRPSLSPVPLTPAKLSITTSSPSPARPSPAARTLNSKRSQSNLLATPRRTIERKRSLQDLTPTTPTARRSAFSPTPGYASPATSSSSFRRANLTPTTPAFTSSSRFAQPTAASVSRTRERVSSGPSPPVNARSPLPSPALPSGPFTTRTAFTAPPRPGSAASIARLAQPTLASRAKARASPSPALSGVRHPIDLNAFRRGPKRSYGDGTELDAFDDLPTSKERERTRVPSRIGTVDKLKSASHTRVPSNSNLPGARRMPELERQDVKKFKLQRDSSLRSKKGKDTMKRREPHLIRNLGGNATPKVQGEMIWNPTLQRWEGNEGVLKEFDRVLSTSTRPALISQLSSSTSPGRINFPDSEASSPAKASSSTGLNLAGANVKVVGSMVFDPVRMSWHSLAGPDDEDELDLFGDSEMDHDDGWEKGEKARMLINRASFVFSDTASANGEEDERLARLRLESRDAVGRHRQEMKGWTTRRRKGANIDHTWLNDIRELILDTGATT